MRMKYELWDTYEGKSELLISSDDIYEIEKFNNQYIEDTDGECELIVKWKNENG